MSSSTLRQPTQRLHRLLKDPTIYRDGTFQVEVLETHMSWVFLSRTLALKLKKPIQFEFVDFSSTAARRAACLEELRLNRHWSQGVYLDVLPVVQQRGGQLALGRPGVPVDWVVKMRRLPDVCRLDKLIHQSRLTTSEEQALADFLIERFRLLRPVDGDQFDYTTRVVAHQRANTSDLLKFTTGEDRHRVMRIHGALAWKTFVDRSLFESRVREGRVFDGHGDLRPEHIYLQSPPQVIDGIEFSSDLRCSDVLDEFCFLAMECEAQGAHRVAHTLIDRYRNCFDDDASIDLEWFYKAYRAGVRAKVELLRVQQLREVSSETRLRSFRQYLSWADDFARLLGRPSVVVVCGLMGTGKSTLARSAADALGATLLQTDRVRSRYLGRSATPAAYGRGLYSPANLGKVYDALLRESAELLEWGRPVVLDGTFLARRQRRQVVDLARRHGSSVSFVRCQAPREVMLSRLAKRHANGSSQSEARPELLDRQAAKQESFAAGDRIIRIASEQPIEHQMEQLRHGLATVA